MFLLGLRALDLRPSGTLDVYSLTRILGNNIIVCGEWLEKGKLVNDKLPDKNTNSGGARYLSSTAMTRGLK